MNVEHQVQQLESLLSRILANAAALASTRAQGLADPGLPAAGVSEPKLEAAAQAAEDDFGEEDFATIPPAAPVKPSAPAPEMRSGLHSVTDLGSGERDLPSLSLEEPPPVSAYAAADSNREADLGSNEPASLEEALEASAQDEAYPVSVEEVTGERPAYVEPEPANAPSVRTPPPESGPQAAPPPQATYNASPELSLSEAPRPSVSAGPTIEQLGSTVELDAGTGPLELHVEVPPGSASPVSTDDEFEAALPSHRFAGTYDESLAPPPSALAELDAHDRAERERAERRSSLPARDVYSQAPPAAMVPPSTEAATTWERPPVLASISAAVYEREFNQIAAPKTFLELLDAALALRQQ